MTCSHWTVAIDGSIQRDLGNSELAFYAPSIPDGVGDMFVHLTLNAPSHSFTPERVSIAWSILRVSHPLLQSKVVSSPNNLYPKFSFTPPKSIEDALSEAKQALSFRSLPKQELINSYLNGPRIILSDQHLSHLTISQVDLSQPEYQVFTCSPHFTGDGTCLHLATYDLVRMLSSDRSNDHLRAQLSDIIDKSHGNWTKILPSPLEAMLPSLTAPWQRAISTVNYLQCKQREIGNHILPRVNNPSANTRLFTHHFNEEDTRAILQVCKAKGVSVNNAISALCAISWARIKSNNGKGSPEDLTPILLYSAINIRNWLPKTFETYWFLALTYFTISLPSFPPTSVLGFWNRAVMSKEQTSQAIKSKFLLYRASLVARTRAKATLPAASNGVVATSSTHCPDSTTPQLPPNARVDPPAPSRALLGLSLLGNLDLIYKQSDYPPEVKLLSFTGASKLKKGGLLFLAHTFRSQLEFHLFWEANGFEEGIIETWWEGVKAGCYEFLLGRK